jgi:hypothetical protein
MNIKKPPTTRRFGRMPKAVKMVRYNKRRTPLGKAHLIHMKKLKMEVAYDNE